MLHESAKIYNEAAKLYLKNNDNLSAIGAKILAWQIVCPTKKAVSEFWFDLKNLSKENTEQVLSLFDDLNEKYDIKEQIIIESTEANDLNTLSKAGYYTCLFLKPVRKGSFLMNFRNNVLNLFHICICNYNAISLPAESYQGIIRTLYRNNNVYLWLFSR